MKNSKYLRSSEKDHPFESNTKEQEQYGEKKEKGVEDKREERRKGNTIQSLVLRGAAGGNQRALAGTLLM